MAGVGAVRWDWDSYLGQIGKHSSLVTSLDLENLTDSGVDGLLVGIVLVSQVVNLTLGALLRKKNEGADHINHVDGVDAKVLGPEQLHLLLQFPVNRANNKTRSYQEQLEKKRAQD
jgi:hypothetical protein